MIFSTVYSFERIAQNCGLLYLTFEFNRLLSCLIDFVLSVPSTQCAVQGNFAGT